MLLKIFSIVTAATVIGITYFYVDAQRGGPTTKSLLLKMTGASCYVIHGFFCLLQTEEYSGFDKAVLLALGLSWAGDFFLHLKQKIFSVVGFCCFFAAHICYIMAFARGIRFFEPDGGFFSLSYFITLAAMLGLFVLFVIKTDMIIKKNIIFAPILLYAAVLSTMFYKAVQLGIAAFNGGAGLFAAINAAVGAACFVLSDFALSVIIFEKKKGDNFNLKLFNMYTYFSAQLMLSSLMAYI